MADPLADAALFEIEAPPPVSLADKFLVPPFSVLRQDGDLWQSRRRAWLSLGIRSEVGRSEELTHSDSIVRGDGYSGFDSLGTTSVFDPVLCELAYRWFSREGARVVDPFCGGSVRGITASTLGRDYLGTDIRPEQVEANRAQAHLGSAITPRWAVGDARDIDRISGGDADLIFTCPPYADLEVYSDDPADLSAMPWPDFLDAYRAAVAASARSLRLDRFSVWVVGDVRDKRTGAYRGLIAETIRAHADAGMALHNEAILVNQIASAAVRAERPFNATRKLTKTHQNVLVFIKGDAKRAAAWCNG